MTTQTGAAHRADNPHLDSYDGILSAAQDIDSGWDFRMITVTGNSSSSSSPMLCNLSGDPHIPSIYICFISASEGLARYNEYLKETDPDPLFVDEAEYLLNHEWFPYSILHSDPVPLSEVGGFAIDITFDDPSLENYFTWDGPSDKGVTSEAFRKMGFAEVKGFNGETDAFCIGRDGKTDDQFADKIINGIKEASRRWERFKAVSPDNS